MKVIYILNSTLLYSGATKAFMKLISGLKECGVSPIVILPDKCGIFNSIIRMGIPVYVINHRMNTYPYSRTNNERVLFFPRLILRVIINVIAIFRLFWIVRKQKADIIHTNIGVDVIGYIVSRILSIPHIYHIREHADLLGMNYFPYKKAFISQLNNDNSYSICVTRSIQRHYNQTDNDNSIVIYDGILNKNQSLQCVRKENYFLFAGRVEAIKGLEFLIDSYIEYCKKTDVIYPLYICGLIRNDAFFDTITKKIKYERIDKFVFFLGEREDIYEIMKKATAIVICSPEEGFGLCMAEAMFYGCLVIGRDTSGTKEQMDNGKNICENEIAIRFNTRQELSEKLLELTTEPTKYEEYVQRAFDVVNKLYTVETCTRNVLGFYNHILSINSSFG